MEKGNQVEDLISLIELAEKTSIKIEKLKYRQYFLVFLLLLLVVATLFSLIQFFIENKLSLELAFFVSSTAAAIFLFGFFMFSKIRYQIKVEYRVAEKLFDLIDPFKSQLRNEISIMRMAAIDLRLSRINFEGYNSGYAHLSPKPKIKKEVVLET